MSRVRRLVGGVAVGGPFRNYIPGDEVGHTAAENPVRYFRHYFSSVIRNKPVLLYLAQDIEFTTAIIAITFYSRYAIQWCGIPVAVTGGIFVILLFTGAVAANLILGFSRRVPLKLRYLVIKLCTVSTLVLLILFKNVFVFYAASFLLGFARSGRAQLYGPVLKNLSGLDDASPYYAIAPFILLPVTSLLPIALGALLDLLAPTGPAAYQAGFAVLLGITLLTLIPFSKLSFPGGIDEATVPHEIEE